MSHSLVDQLKSSITPQLVADAAKSIGESPDATRQAINAALPALLTGVSAATRMPSGLSSVVRLVEDPVNDGTLGTQLSSLYQGTMTASPIFRLGSQLLSVIFGTRLTQVTQGIAALSGMKPASAASLTGMLGAHFLSVLGISHRAAVDHTPGSFASFIERQGGKLTGALPPALAAILSTPGSTATAATTAAATAAATAASTVAAAAASALKPSATISAIKPLAGKPAAPAKPAAEPARTATAVPAATTTGSAKAATRSSPLPWFFLLLGLAWLGLVFGLKHTTETMAPGTVTATAPASTTAAPSATTTVTKTTEAPAAKPAGTKPAAAVATSTAATASLPSGTTTFFGPTPAMKDRPAILNPDYNPSAIVAAAPAAPAPAKPEAKPEAKPVTATPAVIVPPDHIAASPPGVTSFFGATPPVTEAPARLNPDYKPFAEMPAAPATEPVAATATAPVAVPEDKPATSLPGVTSFFGAIATALDLPAAMNPDYKPAPAVAVTPPVVVPEDHRAPSPPGVTSYFGTGSPVAEMPAKPNPDYKSTVTVAAAPAVPATPVVPAAAPAPAPIARAASSGAVTTYFGPGPATAGGTIATAPAATAVAGCQSKVTGAVKSGVVLFRSGRADLTPESLGTLKRIAAAFKGCQGTKLRIDGHTDNSGNADFNSRLSLARAKTVANYMLTRDIELARLIPAGFGFSRPVAPNDTAANKALNRRIEFTVE